MSKRAEMWEKKRLAFLQNQNSASNAGGTGASNKLEQIERVWNENRVQEPAQPIKREDFKMVDVGMPAQDRDRSRTEVHVSKPPGGGSSMDLSWSTSARGKQASDHAPPPKMWNPITGTPRDPGPLGPRKAGMAPAYEHYPEQEHRQRQESQRGAALQQEPMEPNAPQQLMSSSRYDNQAEHEQPGGGGQSFAPAQLYDGSARGQFGGSRGRDDQQRRNHVGSYEQDGGGGGHPSLPAQHQSQSHPFSTRNGGGTVAGASHASGVKPLNLTGLREPGVSSGGAPVRGDDGRTKSSYRAQNHGSAGGTPAGGPPLAADTGGAAAAAAPQGKEHSSHPQPPEQYVTARPAGAYKSSVGNTRASGRVESGRGPIAHAADGGGAAAGVDSRSWNSSAVLRHRARKTQSPTGKIGGGVNSAGSTPSAAAINEQPTFVRKPPGGASSICFG